MKEEVKGGARLTLLTFAVAMVSVAVLFAQGAQAAEDVYTAGSLGVSVGSVDWESVWLCLAMAMVCVDAVLLVKRFFDHRWDLRFGYTDQKSFVKWLLTPWIERFAPLPTALVVGPELKEFYEQLDGHSWHAAFEYPALPQEEIDRSDAEYERLKQIADMSDAHRVLFDRFSLAMFSGDPWTKGQASPKPILATS